MCDITADCSDCARCLTVNVLNGIMSVIVVLMNGVYAVWGLFLPRSDGMTAWKEYAEKLETYLNVVSYSDSILIPIKVVTMILAKWCCGKMSKKRKDEGGSGCEECYATEVERESGRRDGGGVMSVPCGSRLYHSPSGVSTFQLK